MPKRSNEKRRGPQFNQSVKKHKIISRAAQKEEESGLKYVKFEEDYWLGRIRYKQVFSFAEKCWHFMADGCSALKAIPIERQDDRFTYMPTRKRVLSYFVTTGLTLFTAYRLWATLKLIGEQPALGLDTFMSITLFLVSFVAWTFSITPVYYAEETLAVLNSWTPYLEELQRKRADTITERISYCRDISAALKVICVAPLVIVIAVNSAVMSVVFNNIPVCLFPMAESMGLIPDVGWPRIVWTLIFFPPELLLNLMAMSQAGFCGCVLCIGQAIDVISLFEMRNIGPVKDLESRVKVEDLYLRMETFNRHFCCWLKTMTPPAIFSIGSSIVITLYVTIRHTDLPWFIYPWFPYVGVTLQGMLFWLSYDAIVTLRDSEAILADLQSVTVPMWRGVPVMERKRLVKRSKAMQPVSYPLGPFTDFSITVPVAIWDEVLNQLLFLLTL